MTARALIAPLGTATRVVWAARAELGAVLTLLIGWSLVTAFVASYLGARIWLASGGLFALSLFGWRLLWQMASQGLYALSHAGDDDA